MNETYTRFIKDSERKAFDLEHRNKIKFNITKYDDAVEQGLGFYKNLDLARKRAHAAKHKVVNNLDKYLIEFASNFEKNGGKIIWATNTDQAVEEILGVLQKNNVQRVVKSKSMTTEEIELNEALEKNSIESLETDLGEYIVQLAGEKPYHIVTPAMHKSRDDIAELFHEKLQTDRESTPEQLTGIVRDLLRDKFVGADVGITGGNFLVADTGAICITENEGNGMMAMAFPKIHIAIVGVEKVIPSLSDLDLFWPLLASHGTGQRMTVYNSIVTGPKQEGESDGPEQLYLVLLENNRSEILKKKNQRAAMMCIRCGACLNACPVYKNIGGHSYGTTYSGPIGSVITPHLKGLESYKHLSFASSLCGHCSDVCPVKIPIHDLLLENRKDAVKAGLVTSSEKWSMHAMKTMLSSRKKLDFINPRLKNLGMQMVFKKAWGTRRELPKFARKSFRELWEEKKGS